MLYWLFLKCELLDEIGNKLIWLEYIGILFSILKDILVLFIGKYLIDCFSVLSIIKIYFFLKKIDIFLWFIFLDEIYYLGKFWCFFGGWRYIKIVSIDIVVFGEKN